MAPESVEDDILGLTAVFCRLEIEEPAEDAIAEVAADASKLLVEMVEDCTTLLLVTVASKEGFTVAVCWTLEAQAEAATAPTKTDVQNTAGADGNPAHNPSLSQA